MSGAFNRYRRLQEQLQHIRWVHRGLESAEEDQVLAEMDEAWLDMSDDERDLIDKGLS